MDLECVRLYMSAKGPSVLKQHTPLGASVDLRCVFDSCPLQPRWRRLWRFLDRNLQGHHTWLCCCCCWTFPLLLSPSVSHIALPRTAVVICTDEVPLRKWDQAKEETKKDQLELEASQSVALLALMQKTSDRQAARPERSSCQAAVELHVAVLLDLTVC